MNFSVENIGPNVRRLRNDHGLTQADLSQDLGVSTGWVSRLESGDTTPSLGRVLELAALFSALSAFSITPDTLLGPPSKAITWSQENGVG
jgi:transcriptional regulator with XRE-family HTH domain